MKEQITAVVGVFTNPKRTMQDLPSHRLYVLAIMAPVYFGISRAFEPYNNPKHFVTDRPSPTLLVIIALGIAALLYSLFLTIYGFVVSPSEEKAGANKSSREG